MKSILYTSARRASPPSSRRARPSKPRRARAALAVLACLLGAWACGGPPAPPSVRAGSEVSVSGNDRLAWDQRAGSLSVASSYTYWIYVDGSRKRLDDVRCSAGSSRGRFVCSAPLPHLAPGRHVLELSTSTEASGADEGPRSQPIDVVVS